VVFFCSWGLPYPSLQNHLQARDKFAQQRFVGDGSITALTLRL